MKKTLFIAAGLVLFSPFVTTAQWGGSTLLTGDTYRSGRVGIGGTTTPVTQLNVVTASTNDGVRIQQTGTTAASLGLFNNSGHNWALFSTGTGNSEGAGNLGFYDYTASTHRLFIQGSTGNVGIGTSYSAPTARLQVLNNTFSASDNFVDGLFELNLYTDGAPAALKGVATNQYGPTQNLSRGVWGVATTANITGNFSSYNYGVQGTASGGHANYAGSFDASASGASRTAIGIYAGYTATSGATGWAGYFSGSTYCTGTYQGSDKKLKEDIRPLTNAMEHIMQLKPSTYLYKTGEYSTMNLPEGEQLGLIAQELEVVFPQLVREVKGFNQFDENGKVIATIPDFKSVNYAGLVPVLIAAIQEQQTTIAEMAKNIEELKNGQSTGFITNEIEQVKLFQNVPNPFNEQTVIRYSLPRSTGAAFIAVYDLSGKQLMTVPLTEKGDASVTIQANTLSAGMFVYSIIADNKLIDTKRMVITD